MKGSRGVPKTIHQNEPLMKNIPVSPRAMEVLTTFVKEKRGKLSQLKLARKCRLSLRTIAKIESQQLPGASLSSRVLMKLAHGLEVSVDEIFAIVEAPSPKPGTVVGAGDLIPLFKSILQSGLTFCTQDELNFLIAFQEQKGKTPPPNLVGEMILFERKI